MSDISVTAAIKQLMDPDYAISFTCSNFGPGLLHSNRPEVHSTSW